MIGVVVVGIFCSLATAIIFGGLKLIMGVRVSPEEELKGLDISEHGMEAYSGFQIFISQ